MVLLAKLVGIFVAVMGILIIIFPSMIKKFIEFVKANENMIYVGGVIRILFGVIMFIAASNTRMPALIVIFGLIFLITGILAFTLGVDRCNKWLDMVYTKTDNVIRVFAAIAVIYGALIIYAA